jgi:hypothetical protein
MTIEIPESIAQEVHKSLAIANCKDEQEFVLKAVVTQLKSVKKQSPAAIQIKEWLKEAGWTEDKVLEDFDEFRKKLSREQFLKELE